MKWQVGDISIFENFASSAHEHQPPPLTSEPGGAVGLGGRRVDVEALAGQHAAVLGLLHQEAYLGQQPVQETGQHGRASDHHHVLGQNLPGIDGALRGNAVGRENIEFVGNINHGRRTSATAKLICDSEGCTMRLLLFANNVEG